MSAVESLSLDTNIIVYAHDRSELVKFPKAQALLTQLLAQGKPIISTQVLSEFYWTTTRKIPAKLSHVEAFSEVTRLAALTRVIALSPSVLFKSFDLVAAFGMPLWDAQILAVAILEGATTLLTEDLQHRQAIEGVTILNPFASDFDISEILPP